MWHSGSKHTLFDDFFLHLYWIKWTWPIFNVFYQVIQDKLKNFFKHYIFGSRQLLLISNNCLEKGFKYIRCFMYLHFDIQTNIIYVYEYSIFRVQIKIHFIHMQIKTIWTDIYYIKWFVSIHIISFAACTSWKYLHRISYIISKVHKKFCFISWGYTYTKKNTLKKMRTKQAWKPIFVVVVFSNHHSPQLTTTSFCP